MIRAASACIVAALVLGVSTPIAAQSPAPQPPRLVFAFELHPQVAAPLELGDVPGGRRPIVDPRPSPWGRDWKALLPAAPTGRWCGPTASRSSTRATRWRPTRRSWSTCRTSACGAPMMKKLLAAIGSTPARLLPGRRRRFFETAAPDVVAHPIDVRRRPQRYPNEVVVAVVAVEVGEHRRADPRMAAAPGPIRQRNEHRGCRGRGLCRSAQGRFSGSAQRSRESRGTVAPASLRATNHASPSICSRYMAMAPMATGASAMPTRDPAATARRSMRNAAPSPRGTPSASAHSDGRGQTTPAGAGHSSPSQMATPVAICRLTTANAVAEGGRW